MQVKFSHKNIKFELKTGEKNPNLISEEKGGGVKLINHYPGMKWSETGLKCFIPLCLIYFYTLLNM